MSKGLMFVSKYSSFSASPAWHGLSAATAKAISRIRKRAAFSTANLPMASEPVNEIRSRVNAIEKVPLFMQSRTFPFLSMGSFGVRREADRERRTERGHWLRGNMPRHAATWRRNSRATACRQAVTGRRRARRSGRGFLVVRSLRTHGEPNDRKGRDSPASSADRCFVSRDS